MAVTGDTVDEADETDTVTLSNASIADTTGRGRSPTTINLPGRGQPGSGSRPEAAQSVGGVDQWLLGEDNLVPHEAALQPARYLELARGHRFEQRFG